MSFNDNDKKKIEALFLLYGKVMLSVAERILKDTSLAEDAVQQAFERLMKILDRVDMNDVNGTKKFLVIITRNMAINIYNSRKGILSTEYIEELEQEDSEFLQSLKSPCDEIIEKESCSKIMQLINDLSPIYRDIILLEGKFGYTKKEIAKLLNLNYATVKKRSERARAKLEELLKKEGELK